MALTHAPTHALHALTTFTALALAGLTACGCASGDARPGSAEQAARSGPRAGPRLDPWRDYEVGTVIELRTHTIARPPMLPFEAEASIRHEVLALGDDEVTLLTRFQQTDPIGAPEEQQNKIPRATAPELDLGGTFVRNETITVPAGTFDCAVYRAETTERGMKWMRQVWTTPSIPMPVRFVQEGPSSTIVEITKIERPIAR